MANKVAVITGGGHGIGKAIAEDIGCKAESLYLPEWSNALCSDRKNLDVLGVGAYDKDKLIGVAACSADCDDMWQIGLMQALI